MSKLQPAVLIVDDEPFNLRVIEEFLADCNYRLVTATNGTDAWNRLQADPEGFDAVLLDRMMPDMDGIEVLKRIKCDPHLRLLPVIMQTASSAPSQVAEGIREGAYYYLTKPFEPEVLRTVVATAIRDRAEYHATEEHREAEQQAIHLLDLAEFTLQTPANARSVALLLSSFCPSPQAACIGLVELMLNAIEHGNLGISYDEKTQLITENRLYDEIERRLALPEYAGRRATIKFRRTGASLIFTIHDEGNGFDWKPYMEMSVARLMDNHGRGIAMSKSIAFTHIEYRGKGNSVIATIITGL
jgi:CheY-like chemotaxis protein